jgi:hypothetical protein
MSQPSPRLVYNGVYPLADRLTTKHRSAPSLFFQSAKTASHMRAAKVIASYLAALPPVPATAEPNPWIVVLKTGETSTVMIELRQADPLGPTVAVCRKDPRVLKSGELSRHSKGKFLGATCRGQSGMRFLLQANSDSHTYRLVLCIIQDSEAD